MSQQETIDRLHDSFTTFIIEVMSLLSRDLLLNKFFIKRFDSSSQKFYFPETKDQQQKGPFGPSESDPLRVRPFRAALDHQKSSGSGLKRPLLSTDYSCGFWIGSVPPLGLKNR